MSEASLRHPSSEDDRPGPGVAFWIGFVPGVAMMVYAVLGAADNIGAEFRRWVWWLVGADLLHDLIVAPVVVIAGAALTRLIRNRRLRVSVQAGLVASAAVLAVAWIPLRGWGGSANPTVRPINYATSTLTALIVVWAAVILVSVGVAQLAARSRPGSPRRRSGRSAGE